MSQQARDAVLMSRLIGPVAVVYGLFLLPFLGGPAAAWFAYDVLEFSLSLACVCGPFVVLVAFAASPLLLNETALCSWSGLVGGIIRLTAMTLAPVLACAALYFSLKPTPFPALLPAIFAGVCVAAGVAAYAWWPRWSWSSERIIPVRGVPARDLAAAEQQARKEAQQRARAKSSQKSGGGNG